MTAQPVLEVLNHHIQHAAGKHKPFDSRAAVLRSCTAQLDKIAVAQNSGTDESRDERFAKALYHVAAVAIRALIDLELPKVEPSGK